MSWGQATSIPAGYTDSDAVDAVEAASPLNVSILGVADPLGLAWFSSQGLLPATTFLQQFNNFPNPPVQWLGAGSLTLTRSKMIINSVAGSLVGWDLGSGKGEVLAIFGDIRPSGTGADNVNICFSASVPVSKATPAASNLYILETNSARYSLVDAGGGFTPHSVPPGPPTSSAGYTTTCVQVAVAVYYKASTGAIKMFIRTGAGQWESLIEITESTLASVRAVSFFFGGTYTSGLVCPMGIYHS